MKAWGFSWILGLKSSTNVAPAWVENADQGRAQVARQRGHTQEHRGGLTYKNPIENPSNIDEIS